MKTALKLLIVLVIFQATGYLVRAQGTAFSYNGRLLDGGVPANGNYDIEFTVYDAQTGGNQVAGPITLSSVAVTSGLFSVTLDFGAGVFTGPPRWLQIAGRQTGAQNFTTLSPRQSVTASPYAIFAGEAATVANNGIGGLALQDASITAAKIGPGQVVKSINGLTDAVTLQAGANVTLTPNGNNILLSAASGAAGLWGLNGTSAYYTAGKVGIGTTTPDLTLSLSGGPTWTANGWLGCLELPNASAIAWQANPAGQRFGIGHSGGGFYVFRTASDPGATGSAASYDLIVNDAGGVEMSGNVTVGGVMSVSGNGLSVSGAQPGVELSAGLAIAGGSDWLMQVTPADGGNLEFNHWTPPGPPNLQGTWGSSLMSITPGGQVGIGTSSPGATLDVRGSVNFQGPLTVGDNFTATIGCADLQIGWSGRRGSPGRALTDFGTTLAINCCGDWATTTVGGGNFSVCSLTIRGGCDLAEPFPTADEHLKKGAVMVIDARHPGQLKLSDHAYDTCVAGIISGAQGINPGISLHQEGVMESGQDIALSGRVYVQADATFGSIEPGDLLTTSDTPGHAMKVTDRARAQGAVLGKAMSSLAEGKGMVLMLVTLQ